VIAPCPFPTIKNVPPHVQGQLLDTMRKVLQHVSDAAIGPDANELEFERWSKLPVPGFDPQSPTSGGKERSQHDREPLGRLWTRRFCQLA
jgi:hypothetical protein